MTDEPNVKISSNQLFTIFCVLSLLMVIGIQAPNPTGMPPKNKSRVELFRDQDITYAKDWRQTPDGKYVPCEFPVDRTEPPTHVYTQTAIKLGWKPPKYSGDISACAVKEYLRKVLINTDKQKDK